jgi:hypothetical protein
VDAPFLWNGNGYSVTGIYIDTLISVTGCDSIATLDLTVNPTLFGQTTAVICDMDAPFLWNGNGYSVTGIYVDTLISVTGCDSIATLNLTINPTQYGQSTAVICDVDAPFLWNGNGYSLSGIYVDTLVSVTGCDSIATLDLTVNPTLFGQTIVVICDNQIPYIWNGNFYSVNGIYIDTLIAITGCDSIVSLNLTVNPTSISHLYDTICLNNLPYWWNGNMYNTAGIYNMTFSNQYGCDSIAYLHLKVDPIGYGSMSVTICQNQTPYVWNGNNYFTSGIYSDTLTTNYGCDFSDYTHFDRQSVIVSCKSYHHLSWTELVGRRGMANHDRCILRYPYFKSGMRQYSHNSINRQSNIFHYTTHDHLRRG